MTSSMLEEAVYWELCKLFGENQIRRHIHPLWLDGLELDFYIHSKRLAIEVQGNQHFEFVPFFHGDESGFERQQERDAKKASLCRENNIKLIYIASELEMVEYFRNELWPYIDGPTFSQIKSRLRKEYESYHESLLREKLLKSAEYKYLRRWARQWHQNERSRHPQPGRSSKLIRKMRALLLRVSKDERSCLLALARESFLTGRICMDLGLSPY